MTRYFIFFWALTVASTAFAAAPYAGRPVQDALEELRSDELKIVYSSRLVPSELTVEDEPASGQPLDVIREILQPHGLGLNEVDGVHFVVRLAEDGTSIPGASVGDAGTLPEPPAPKLEEIVVAASRYLLFSNSQFFIDQRAIQAMPDLGEDPVRAAHRLPGSAAGGLSSRSHFRGGEHNETAIYLNGLKLIDPFHIRDYHNIFSSIDARAVSGIEAYTGGFPVAYGDQTSGILLLETRRSEEPMHTELGLSFFNASILNSGYSEDERFDWLVSARKSSLDAVLSDDLGKPDYSDVFAGLGVRLNDRHHLSFNALYALDKVTVTTENDPEELEQSVSDSKNTQLWVTLESEWTSRLDSTTVLSFSSLNADREAEVNDPDRMTGRVSDRRDARVLGFRQDWRFGGIDGHLLGLGLEYSREEADYAYRSAVEYSGLYEWWPGIENPAASAIDAMPEGNSYSLYLSDRWSLGGKSSVELGLRWDRQTYTGPSADSQLNPRIGFLHRFGPNTELRLTWGRYSQPQDIQDLQVEDGVSRFFEPQRADHWIAGLSHRFGDGYRLRAEAFYKDYSRLKPRFENLYDSLAMIPELAPDRVRLDPESARAAGIELTLEYGGRENLDWWLTYSLAKVTDRIGGKDQPRSWDQRHALQGGIAWRPGPWEIGVAMSVHTGWPTTGMTLGVAPPEEDDDEPVYYPIPGPRNAERLGTFAQIDFRISRQIPVRHGRLSAFFEVTNATNRRNECCVDYDIEEDDDGTVYLDRSMEHWLPLIPSIGLFWEF